MEDIPLHHNLRDLAAKEFLKEELNWQVVAKIKTNWSRDRSILWLSFQDEKLVSSIFKKQAEIKNGRIKLFKFIPSWCYERNRELEILCRMERDKDKDLRTKVLLGKDDLILGIKRKGENFYKWVSVEHFGVIPGFNFKKTVSLESPSGRECLGGDVNDRSSIRKRPLPPIIFAGEFKPSKDDRSHVVMREGFNFKKIESPKSPPGRNRLGGDDDVRSSKRKGSLWSESSYETFPLESKQRTEDRDQNESRDGSYLPHSRLF